MMMKSAFFLLVLASCACMAAAQSFHQGGPITSLPGYTGAPLNQSSGYITVDTASNRSVFYWLIEAEENPETAPLVFWTNGGPGCSGLIGLFTEHGPFTPNTNGGLDSNPFTWQKTANMLYVEQPAGVGFSFSDNVTDYNTDDAKAAADNYEFIQLWLEVYPQYVGRDFWISGESYGGVYVPTFAYNVIHGDNSTVADMLKGIMIGNPVMDCPGPNYLDIQFQLFYWHGLVSYTNYHNWTANDCSSGSGYYGSDACQGIFNAAVEAIGIIDQELLLEKFGMAGMSKKMAVGATPVGPSLDPDDLYQDFCTGNGTLEAVTSVGTCYPLGNLTVDYLNNPTVQKAIHAVAPSYGWIECSPVLNYTFGAGNMVAYYEDFFVSAPNLNILIYSGDVDIATCPFAQTQPCLFQMAQNTTQVSEWAPWYVNGVTVGYVESYEKFTYATIKGAGHEAPEYQPLVAYNMFTRFLSNQSLNEPAYDMHMPSTTFASSTQSQRLREAMAVMSGN